MNNKGQVPWNKGQRLPPRSAEHCMKISIANRGRKQSLEERAMRSAIMRVTFSDPRLRLQRSIQAKERWLDPVYRSKACHRLVPTSLEYALQLLLESAGFEYKAQEPFARYTVDFWVPDRGLVFEADGYYHITLERQKQDLARDFELLTDKRIKAVIHLTANDLSPWREV